MIKKREDNAEEFKYMSNIARYLVSGNHPLSKWFSEWVEDNYQLPESIHSEVVYLRDGAEIIVVCPHCGYVACGSGKTEIRWSKIITENVCRCPECRKDAREILYDNK